MVAIPKMAAVSWAPVYFIRQISRPTLPRSQRRLVDGGFGGEPTELESLDQQLPLALDNPDADQQLSSYVWICTSTHSASTVTVIDAKNPEFIKSAGTEAADSATEEQPQTVIEDATVATGILNKIYKYI
jgi:hypothetical protein